jgi:hypothetical protein
MDELLYSRWDLQARQRKAIDTVRQMLLNSFNDIAPLYVSDGYTQQDFIVSNERQKHIKESWFTSKFYNDFKEEDVVKDVKPWSAFRDTLDNKLYSLATVYENKA